MAGKLTYEELEKRVIELEKEVAERDRVEKELRENEEKYHTILESIDEGYYEVDLAGNFTFFNEALCRIHEYPYDELMGMNNREYTSPEEAKRIYTFYNKLYRTGVSSKIIDHEVIRKNGSKRILELSASLLRNISGEPIGFHGIARDRTDQKKAEMALQQSEENLHITLNSIGDAVIATDISGQVMRMNPVAEELTGWRQDAAEGRTLAEVFSIIHEETRDRVASPVDRVLRDGRIVGLGNHVILLSKDGTERPIADSAAPIRNEKGDLAGVVLVFRDVTEKRKDEKALRESEEKYRLLVENATEAIYITQDGAVKFPNPRTLELTGHSAEELASMPFLNLVHPEDRDIVLEQQPKKLEPDQPSSTYSFRIINRENATLWVELNTVPIAWEGSPATLNFLRDITPQKKMEAQLLQANKMEAIGTLAGGIAHDFNNLLMGIQGNASLILLDIDSDHPHHDKLRSIEELIKAGSELTKQLLGFARGGKYEVNPTNLNKLIGGSSELFGRTRKEISIHKELQEDLWVVEVDRGQMEQVLLNLYVNAWHAMPGGGNLYLETRNVTLDKYYVRPYDIAPGRFVRISVTDSGMGMDQPTLKKVFDPFFTTKEMGRGTGLGLASTYGIVKNHNGIINAYSEKGEGTTFNIYLPVSEKEIMEEADSHEEILLGTETILFVDDEDTIIKIGHQILERLGYRVITARSGDEAIEIFHKERSQIDLVILDMIMPGMSGGDTFDRLKEIYPSVKVLLSSGYSINGQAKTILDRGCKGFIQKPFNVGDLSKKLRQILDE